MANVEDFDKGGIVFLVFGYQASLRQETPFPCPFFGGEVLLMLDLAIYYGVSRRRRDDFFNTKSL